MAGPGRKQEEEERGVQVISGSQRCVLLLGPVALAAPIASFLQVCDVAVPLLQAKRMPRTPGLWPLHESLLSPLAERDP